MFAGKPIIGIVGGIGSGKSFVADRFGELGCLVIKSDEQVREAFADERVKRAVRQWWGESVFNRAGEVDRGAVAQRVFSDAGERSRLEGLLHPMVAEARDERMRQAAGDAQVIAFVWDTPLLFEAGLNRQCDAVVFVSAPLEVRAGRVKASRGWSQEELEKREKSQLPLDKKEKMSDYIINNTADAGDVGSQVREVLSRILAMTAARSTPE